MSRDKTNDSRPEKAVDRRQFMGSALGAAAGLGAAALAAGPAAAQTPPAPAPGFRPGSAPNAPGAPGAPGGPPQGSDIEQRYGQPGPRLPQLFRIEQDIAYCEVDGKLPSISPARSTAPAPMHSSRSSPATFPSTAKVT